MENTQIEYGLNGLPLRNGKEPKLAILVYTNSVPPTTLVMLDGVPIGCIEKLKFEISAEDQVPLLTMKRPVL